MSISPRWSRLLLAGALAAGVGCAGATSASASEGPKNTGGCNIPLPLSGDSATYTPSTGVNYGVGTKYGNFLGAYGTNYGDFDLAYQRDSNAPGTISSYFEYWYPVVGGGCNTYISPTVSIGPGQTTFYEFRNLDSWSGGAVVGMYTANEGWAELSFD